MKNKTRHIDYTPWPTELTKQERINRQIEKTNALIALLAGPQS